MNRLDLYKDWYYKEFDRRKNIHAELRMPITIITIDLAFLLNASQNINVESLSLLSGFSIGLTSMAFGAALYTAWHLYSAYHKLRRGHFYEYLPPAKEIESYYHELEEYHLKVTESENVGEKADQALEAVLIEYYIKGIDKSFENNSRKQAHLTKAKEWLFYSLILALLSFAFTLIG